MGYGNNLLVIGNRVSKKKQKTAHEEPEFYNDITKVLPAAWDFMEEGVRDRHSLAHTPVVSTLDVDGNPSARCMVLRAVHRQKNILVFHTDRRSMKANELKSSSEGAVLFYDPKRKIQLRLRCGLSLDTDSVKTNERWGKMKEMSKVCYQSTLAPGDPITYPEQVQFLGEGFENFAILTATVKRMDFLYLSFRGNRRALFDWVRTGGEDGKWLAP